MWFLIGGLAAASPLRPPTDYHPLTSLAPLVEAVLPAVVALEIEEGPPADLPPMLRALLSEADLPMRTGEGSGFLVSSTGLVLTNAHVVVDARRLTARLANGERLEARLVGTDPELDVALLRLEGPGPWPYVALGSSEALRVGDWLVVIGNPLGLGHTVTAGVLSGVGRSLDAQGPRTESFLQTDAAINEGNSGGPVFNLQGQAVGVATAVIQGANTLGFAIPADLVKPVISDLELSGRVRRGHLNARLEPVGRDVAATLGLSSGRGALVAEVQGAPKLVPADALHQGDIVLSLDGFPVRDPQHLQAQLAQARAGQQVNLRVLRRGNERDLQVTLGERPTEIEALGMTFRFVQDELQVVEVTDGSRWEGLLQAGDALLQVDGGAFSLEALSNRVARTVTVRRAERELVLKLR